MRRWQFLQCGALIGWCVQEQFTPCQSDCWKLFTFHHCSKKLCSLHIHVGILSERSHFSPVVTRSPSWNESMYLVLLVITPIYLPCLFTNSRRFLSAQVEARHVRHVERTRLCFSRPGKHTDAPVCWWIVGTSPSLHVSSLLTTRNQWRKTWLMESTVQTRTQWGAITCSHCFLKSPARKLGLS